LDAVIMTGGKGTRLRPYTTILPKGLLPINHQPILEIIVKQLCAYRFKKITMSCGYLSYLIQTYFGDGKKWGVEITYLEEEEPLGTAGSLSLLSPPVQSILVMNCDLLTDLDLRKFYQFHEQQGGLLTLASQTKTIAIESGVIQSENHLVTEIIEKPDHPVQVSMGIYALRPEILSYIPRNQFYTMPELIHSLLSHHHPVFHYPNHSLWIDIGTPLEYERANCLAKSAEDLT
jgi:NDP-sugar pyrophosphorylase family protein